MLYATIDAKKKLLQYPANPNEDHSHISIPEGWAGGKLNGKNYVRVVEVDPPSKFCWKAVEGTPKASKGVWYQTWTLVLLERPELKAAIKEKRWRVQHDGIVLGGKRYQTDEGSLRFWKDKIDQKVCGAIDWLLPDDTVVTLSSADWHTVYRTARDHVEKAFDRQVELFKAIDAAKTDEELEKIDYAAGWMK